MSYYLRLRLQIEPRAHAGTRAARRGRHGGAAAGLCAEFHKRAHDHPGRAYANIRHQRDAVVEGVLYRLADEREIFKMDVFEGTPIFYSRERMALHTEQGQIAAWLYVANPRWRSEGLAAPSRAYLVHLLRMSPLSV